MRGSPVASMEGHGWGCCFVLTFQSGEHFSGDPICLFLLNIGLPFSFPVGKCALWALGAKPVCRLYPFFSSCPPHVFCNQLCNALVKALLLLMCLLPFQGWSLLQGRERATPGRWEGAWLHHRAQVGFAGSGWYFWRAGVSVKQCSVQLYFSVTITNKFKWRSEEPSCRRLCSPHSSLYIKGPCFLFVLLM